MPCSVKIPTTNSSLIQTNNPSVNFNLWKSQFLKHWYWNKQWFIFHLLVVDPVCTLDLNQHHYHHLWVQSLKGRGSKWGTTLYFTKWHVDSKLYLLFIWGCKMKPEACMKSFTGCWKAFYKLCCQRVKPTSLRLIFFLLLLCTESLQVTGWVSQTVI